MAPTSCLISSGTMTSISIMASASSCNGVGCQGRGGGRQVRAGQEDRAPFHAPPLWTHLRLLHRVEPAKLVENEARKVDDARFSRSCCALAEGDAVFGTMRSERRGEAGCVRREPGGPRCERATPGSPLLQRKL